MKLCIISLFVCSSLASADVIFVDSTPAGSANDGSSWEAAFTHLQSALATAKSGDEIWVAKGAYYPDLGTGQVEGDRDASFTLSNGVKLLGGFAGTETALFERDVFANQTFLVGNMRTPDIFNDNSFHILTAPSGTDSSALLDGFIIGSGGNLIYESEKSVGAGLLCILSSPTISNCTFTKVRTSFGGAIYNDGASPTITDCTFLDNSANNGGAIQNVASASPLITRCTFTDNRAFNSGGAIFNESSNPTLIDCTFTSNNAGSSGGAVFNHSVPTPGSTQSSPMITGCHFLNNTSGDGGALYNEFLSNPTLVNCIFAANSGRKGGAIFNESASPSLTNCRLSGNRVSQFGGAIFNEAPSGDPSSNPTLINCSISGNSAGIEGGAFFNEARSHPVLINCLVWNNERAGSTGSISASVFHSIPAPTYSHSLVENIDLSSTGINNLDGTDPLNDPRFVITIDPASAPTTDGDLRLLSISPALDAGDNTANSETLDIEGATRIQNTTIDLGAYEGANQGGPITFSALYGGISPDGDENNNGFTNFQDYAVGFDPFAPHDPDFFPQLNGTTLTFSFRHNTEDVISEYQKSSDLSVWSSLIEISDYTEMHSIEIGTRTLLSFELVLSAQTPQFFKQSLSAADEN